jgi:hypothetical protein
MNETAQILVRHNVDLKTFREEIVPQALPVVLKDLVKDWPAVQAGRESPRALANFLHGLDRGNPILVMDAPPSVRGRIFYREDMSGLNFERRPGTISATLERLLGQAQDPNPPTVFIESAPTESALPAFSAAHPMPLVAPEFQPRIWIGNFVTVRTHFDLFENIACVVGGRRRFTLFPPDQVTNLYLGPIDFTPSGVPVSMVPLHEPDLARFPRFAEALRQSRSAELEPGDALYIPYGWWHHVESLTPFNVLVNYWWNTAPNLGSPYGVLLHAALTLRDLPADQRAVWRALFDNFIFTDPETSMGHLSPEKRGLLGPRSAARTREVRSILGQMFNKPGT